MQRIKYIKNKNFKPLYYTRTLYNDENTKVTIFGEKTLVSIDDSFNRLMSGYVQFEKYCNFKILFTKKYLLDNFYVYLDIGDSVKYNLYGEESRIKIIDKSVISLIRLDDFHKKIDFEDLECIYLNMTLENLIYEFNVHLFRCIKNINIKQFKFFIK